jgi:hypothetical protein
MQTSRDINIYYFTICIKIRFSFVAQEMLLSNDPHPSYILHTCTQCEATHILLLASTVIWYILYRPTAALLRWLDNEVVNRLRGQKLDFSRFNLLQTMWIFTRTRTRKLTRIIRMNSNESNQSFQAYSLTVVPRQFTVLVLRKQVPKNFFWVVYSVSMLLLEYDFSVSWSRVLE